MNTLYIIITIIGIATLTTMTAALIARLVADIAKVNTKQNKISAVYGVANNIHL